MPTKAELEEEIEGLQKKISSLTGQVTKWKNKAKEEVEVAEPATDDVSGPANDLVDVIRARGLEVQVGQKQLRLLCEALGRDFAVANR